MLNLTLNSLIDRAMKAYEEADEHRLRREWREFIGDYGAGCALCDLIEEMTDNRLELASSTLAMQQERLTRLYHDLIVTRRS